MSANTEDTLRISTARPERTIAIMQDTRLVVDRLTELLHRLSPWSTRPVSNA